MTTPSSVFTNPPAINQFMNQTLELNQDTSSEGHSKDLMMTVKSLMMA